MKALLSTDMVHFVHPSQNKNYKHTYGPDVFVNHLMRRNMALTVSQRKGPHADEHN